MDFERFLLSVESLFLCLAEGIEFLFLLFVIGGFSTSSVESSLVSCDPLFLRNEKLNFDFLGVLGGFIFDSEACVRRKVSPISKENMGRVFWCLLDDTRFKSLVWNLFLPQF